MHKEKQIAMNYQYLQSGQFIQRQPSKIVILGLPFSGKHAVQKILMKKHGFRKMKLPTQQFLQRKSKSKSKGSNQQLSSSRLNKSFYLQFDQQAISISSSQSENQDHVKIEQEIDIDMTKYGGVTDLCYKNYTQRGVFIMQKPNFKALKHLKQRNFINVIFIDAPFAIRYKYASLQSKEKYLSKYSHIIPENSQKLTMEQFSKIDLQYQTNEYFQCLEYVRVKIVNKGTLTQLQQEIISKNKSIIRKFRPSWDQYFMKLADIARRRSNCMKSSVGAIIVNQQNRVVSTGYNGTPRGLLSCFKGGCKRCNNNVSNGLDTCLCLHGQQSAIIQVGIKNTIGCKLYTTLYPCFSCAKIIKQAGIKKIYYMDPYEKQDSGKKFLMQNFNQEDIKQIIVDNLYY